MIESGNNRSQIKKILIHHHAVAYQEKGQIWVQSFIGQWIEQLSFYFEQIGLLLYISKYKQNKQDFCLSQNNIRLIPLGFKRKGQWLKKRHEIITRCKKCSHDYDLLLIRGLTPYQIVVYRNCQINFKAYLLVGSIVDNKQKFGYTLKDIIAWILYWKRLYELREISKHSLMLANSPGLVKELNQIYKVNAHFTPTNTILKENFFKQTFRGFVKPIKLLFCGRVVKEKGIEDLLYGISILNAKGVICTIDVVGEIRNAYKVKLISIMRKLGINEQVCFSNFVPYGPQLFQHYINASIFVLPSWHEGFPHSIWEAAATFTPIITTPVGGIPDLITQSEVYFVRPKSPVSITETIQMVINEEDELKHKMINVYNKAMQFTADRCAYIMSEALRNFVSVKLI